MTSKYKLSIIFCLSILNKMPLFTQKINQNQTFHPVECLKKRTHFFIKITKRWKHLILNQIIKLIPCVCLSFTKMVVQTERNSLKHDYFRVLGNIWTVLKHHGAPFILVFGIFVIPQINHLTPGFHVLFGDTKRCYPRNIALGKRLSQYAQILALIRLLYQLASLFNQKQKHHKIAHHKLIKKSVLFLF